MDTGFVRNGNSIQSLPTGRFVTISDLYKGDLPKGGIVIPQHPFTYSSFPEELELLHNENKYKIDDISMKYDRFQHKYCFPHRYLCVLGDHLHVWTGVAPPEHLLAHQQNVLGVDYIQPRFDKFDSDLPHVVHVPLQKLAPDLHSVDPDVHYKMHAKQFIAEVPCPQARILSLDKPAFPCVVKQPWGNSGNGVQFARDACEFERVCREMKGCCGELMVTECIQNVKANYCVYIYVTRGGEHVVWLGASDQEIENDAHWVGATVDLDKQKMVKDAVSETVMTVAKTLAKHGYFGVVGIDILFDANGEQYVIDINPRLGGSVALLLLANRFAESCRYGRYGKFSWKGACLHEVYHRAEVLVDGKVVVVAARETEEVTEAAVVMLATDRAAMTNMEKIFT